MGIMGRDTSGYATRPVQSRWDQDNCEYIYVRAHGDLTAKTAYLAYKYTDGWRTCALFDAGKGSITTASAIRYVAAVPPTAISSGTDGWVQCGGPVTSLIFDSASTSMSTGNPCLWVDATVTGNAVGVTLTSPCVSAYGICMATASGGVYDVYLLGSAHLMSGQT